MLTPAMLRMVPCGQAPSVLLVSITLRRLGVLWRRLLKSCCENDGESGDTASRTFKGEMRSQLPCGEFDDTAVRDLESSPRTEMEVHRFPESGLEFISRPVKERWKGCPQECCRDQLRTYGDEPHTQSCEGSWGEQRGTCGDEPQAHHHPEAFGDHVVWTFKGEREIHHQERDTWDVRGQIGDIIARSLEGSLRTHHRPGELQDTVLRTLEGLIHDQLEDSWRIDGETSGSEPSGDRRKRSRETVMELHENGVRQAHHSGENENLKRNRETSIEDHEDGMRSAHHSGEIENPEKDRDIVMEVYESVPRHAQARHFRENERTEERSPEIDHEPLDCWDIMARTCETPEDQGGIMAKVLRDALQVPHQHAESYHIPQDDKDFEESGIPGDHDSTWRDSSKGDSSMPREEPRETGGSIVVMQGSVIP